MFCQPKITLMEHTQALDALIAQRDTAERGWKETLVELNLMTQELKHLTREMKEQSDAIDAHLATIATQRTTIQELEARIAALEKDDPDLSIYEDTMGAEEERSEELRFLEACVVICLVAVALLLIGAHIVNPGAPKSLSPMDL